MLLIAMILQFLCLVAVAACSAQEAHFTFPAKITNTSDGVCPSEEQRAETRQQIFDEAFAILTPGLSEDNPASSCSAIPAGRPSGYYWIQPATENVPIRLYCDMTRSCGGVTGGWMRMAYLDMTNSSHQCPSGLRQRTDLGVRTCAINSGSPSCSSVILSSHALSFSRVCGRIRAYQVGSPDTFGDTGRGLNPGIDEIYVDGVSLTHGNPRQHIWTFAAGLDEVSTIPQYNCPCTDVNHVNDATQPPSFVGSDYFCDTGSVNSFDGITFHRDDPLWDGVGCGPRNSCCTLNNPPWFYKQLPQPTTDDIEMRLCRDQPLGDEDIAIEAIEIYVQ